MTTAASSSSSLLLQRSALPLRLVHSSWDFLRFAPPGSVGGATTGGAHRNNEAMRNFLCVYKPGGLPTYSSLHVRRMRDASGRYIHAQSQDLQDSVHHRVVDNTDAGSTPYIFDGVSPEALLPIRSSSSSQDDVPLRITDWMSRGLALVSRSKSVDTFLTQCSHFRLVHSTFYVWVHVPDCVFVATQRQHNLLAAQRQQWESRYTNPYLVDHLQRKSQSDEGRGRVVDMSGGNSVAPCGRVSILSGLTGSLYDARGLLKSDGEISCVLSRRDEEEGDSARQRRDARDSRISSSASGRRRLANLFEPVNSSAPRDPTCGSCCMFDDTTPPPPLRAATHVMRGLLHSIPRNETEHYKGGDTPRLRRRSIQGDVIDMHLRFRLVQLSSTTAPIALYEIDTSSPSALGASAYEEIIKVFALHRMYVVGDVVYNEALRRVVLGMGEHCRTVMLSGAAGATGSQRTRLQSAGIEDVVLQPLLRGVSRGLSGGETAMASLLAEGAFKAWWHDTPKSPESVWAADERITKTTLLRWMDPLLTGFGLGILRTKVRIPLLGVKGNELYLQHLLSSPNHVAAAAVGGGDMTTDSASRHSLLEYHTYDVGVLPSYFLKYSEQCRRSDDALPQSPTAVTEMILSAQQQLLSVAAEESDAEGLFCPRCRQRNHTLQQCSLAHTPLAESTNTATTTTAGEGTNNNTNALVVSPSDDAQQSGEDSKTSSSLPATLSELKALLASNNNGSDDVEHGETVVRVPNALPSVPFQRYAGAARYRGDSKTPSLHRTKTRCAYCHGMHHITMCPNLTEDGSDTSSPSSEREHRKKLLPINMDAAKENPELLFCIRCGQRGHLVAACPTLPKGLHPAMRCRVCLAPKQKILHSDDTCPKRIDVPEGFLSSGVHRSLTESLPSRSKPSSLAKQKAHRER